MPRRGPTPVGGRGSPAHPAGGPRRAIRAPGAVEEGTPRRHVVLGDGFVRDTTCFPVLDRDSPDVRTRRLARLGARGGTMAAMRPSPLSRPPAGARLPARRRPAAVPRGPALALLACAAALAACDRPARVEIDPPSLRFHARGQSAPVRATVRGSSGKPLPAAGCDWTSSDPRVATVQGKLRDATVTAVGPGAAAVRCTADRAGATAQVVVRIAAGVEASPARLDLRLEDAPAPAALQVRVLDTDGRPLSDRPVATRCADEGVCRGDDRGQVWPVGPGETRVTVQVDAASTSLPVKVVDARTAEGRPRRVKGNPMLDVEKAFAPPRR